MDAASQLVYCGAEPLRFSFPSRPSRFTSVPVRSRARKILAVATDPKPTKTGPAKPSQTGPTNGSARPPASKAVNGVSTVQLIVLLFLKTCVEVYL